jgi:hypothetical protein
VVAAALVSMLGIWRFGFVVARVVAIATKPSEMSRSVRSNCAGDALRAVGVVECVVAGEFHAPLATETSAVISVAESAHSAAALFGDTMR